VLHTVPSEQALCPRRRVGAPHERTHGEQWISVQMVPAVLMPRKVGAPPRGLIEEHDSESTDTFRPVRSSTGLLKQWVRDVPPKQVIVLQVLNLRVERWHVRVWCAGAGPRRRVSCCCSEARVQPYHPEGGHRGGLDARRGGSVEPGAPCAIVILPQGNEQSHTHTHTRVSTASGVRLVLCHTRTHTHTHAHVRHHVDLPTQTPHKVLRVWLSDSSDFSDKDAPFPFWRNTQSRFHSQRPVSMGQCEGHKHTSKGSLVEET
jgi:hypothetical protein